MQTKEELILKLFSKKCSKTELRLLLEMIRENPTDTPPEVMDELFEQIKDSETVKEETFLRVWQKVADQTSDLQPKSNEVQLWRHRRLFLRIAASVALVIASFFIIQYYLSENWVVEQSVAGQIRTVSLPDGSLVTLNGNSTLRYPEDWSEHPIRTVQLEGEAYFKVRNFGDGTTKFQVMTSDLTVEVLGTSFNVVSWKEETSVFLEEGKVNVKLDNSADRQVNLNPGEVMRYSTRQQKLLPPKPVAKQLEVSWKQGILEFEETLLKDILHRLASPNNLTYTIMNEALSNRKFTLRIPTEDMEVALDVLSRLTGTKIDQIDNQLIIKERTPEPVEQE